MSSCVSVHGKVLLLAAYAIISRKSDSTFANFSTLVSSSSQNFDYWTFIGHCIHCIVPIDYHAWSDQIHLIQFCDPESWLLDIYWLLCVLSNWSVFATFKAFSWLSVGNYHFIYLNIIYIKWFVYKRWLLVLHWIDGHLDGRMVSWKTAEAGMMRRENGVAVAFHFISCTI